VTGQFLRLYRVRLDVGPNIGRFERVVAARDAEDAIARVRELAHRDLLAVRRVVRVSEAS